MVKFSNPRLEATIPDWPLANFKRGWCVFYLEQHSKKWRFVRTTTGKPKKATYGGEGAIVDGDDGKTYLIQRAGAFDFINVWDSSFHSVSGVFPESAPELFAELDDLIKQANKQ